MFDSLLHAARLKGYSENPFSVALFLIDYSLRSYLLVLLARIAPPGFTTLCHRLRGTKIGRDVFIDRFAVIDGSFPERIAIEDEVRVAPGAVIVAHYMPGSKLAEYTEPYVLDVRVCRWAFIGVNSVVMPGVTVGEGAIVTSGSVVLRDVAPFTVVSGNPARRVARVQKENARV